MNKKGKVTLILLSVVIGIGIALSGLVPAQATPARTIDMKYGAAVGAITQIATGSGVLYKISGFASSANATYAIHDTNDVSGGTTTNVMAEGGEATQYDSFPTLDFGDDGLNFTSGLLVYTTTATVSVQYR